MFSKIVILIVGLFCFAAPVAAQTPETARASDWIVTTGSRIRLVLQNAPQKISPGETLIGGIELQLEPGAKTYWRTPGDSGVPPTADFSGSTSVSDVVLEFPAPSMFGDGAGGISFGYQENQIFPIRFRVPAIEEKGAATAPTLSIDFNYGVCVRNMCVPAQAKLALALGQGQVIEGMGERLTAALDRLPKRTVIGAGDGIGVSAITLRRQGNDVELTVVARTGAAAANAHAFVEARDMYALAARIDETGATTRFRFKTAHYPAASPADNLTAEQLGRARVTLTIPGKAIEVDVDLDAVTKAN